MLSAPKRGGTGGGFGRLARTGRGRRLRGAGVVAVRDLIIASGGGPGRAGSGRFGQEGTPPSGGESGAAAGAEERRRPGNGGGRNGQGGGGD